MTTHIEIKNKQLTEKQQSNKNQQQIEDDASKKIKVRTTAYNWFTFKLFELFMLAIFRTQLKQ